MPDDYEIAQRSGVRGGFPRSRFPGGRFPRRFPGRRFPRFFFFPFYNIPPRCDYIDRFGRCCDYYGNCYYDYYGGAYQDVEDSDDSVAVWSPSETWERIEEPGTSGDYYDQY